MLFIILLFFFLNYIVFYHYNLHYIYYVAYILAYIPYYFNERRNRLIVKNLIEAFPNITNNKINTIKFHSWKFFIMNILICFNQYLFSNSFLTNYYDNPIVIPKKAFVALSHLGIYYDFTSIYIFTKKSLCSIYKGYFKLIYRSNFKWKINNKYINLIPNKNLDVGLINKYSILVSPIDHAINNIEFKAYGISLNFLNRKCSLNNFLIDYAVSDKRDIYFYNVIFQDFKLKVNLIKINQKDKTVEEITRELAKNIEDNIRKYPEQYFWSHLRFDV